PSPPTPITSALGWAGPPETRAELRTDSAIAFEMLVDAEVAFARVAQDGHDVGGRSELAGHVERDGDVGPAAHAHQDTFLTSQEPLGLVGPFVADGSYLICDLWVVVGWDEAGRDTLDLGGTARAPRNRRATLRLDRDDPAAGVELLEAATDAAHGATGPHGGDERAGTQLGKSPVDLERGCLGVDLRVGWVVELVGEKGARSLPAQLLGAPDG